MQALVGSKYLNPESTTLLGRVSSQLALMKVVIHGLQRFRRLNHFLIISLRCRLDN